MNTKTITQKMYICYDTSPFLPDEWVRLNPLQYKPNDESDQVFICESEVTFKVPADFDPRGLQIDQLRRMADRVRADYQNKLTAIERRIGELLAIENGGAT